MKKRFKRLAALLIVGFAGYIIGIIDANIQNESINRAANALQKTGLCVDCAPSYSLYGFIGFRDTFTQTKFKVEYESERKLLLDEMKVAKGWHMASVTAEEFRQFQEACAWGISGVLEVPDDVIFDAWYYRETDEPYGTGTAPQGALGEIGQVGRGYEFAVYDMQSGIFILIDQFG